MTEHADRLGLPWDFRAWTTPGQLIQWIAEDVDKLDWTSPALAEVTRSRPDFRPQVMLRLLIYSYATGLYESDEIVNACYGDPTLRALCEHRAPTAKEMVAFRRENRELLAAFLVQLFKRALRLKCGEFPVSAGLKKVLGELAAARIDIARHMDAAA